MESCPRLEARGNVSFVSTKRQTTFAKLERERAVKELRRRKQEKRDAAAAERRASSAEARGEGADAGPSTPEDANPLT